MTALPREQQAAALEKEWAENPRWKGIQRGYGASDVVRLRGSVPIEHTLARRRREFKAKIVESSGGDTTITRCYSGKPMRVITNPYVEEQERHPEQISRFPEQMGKSFVAGVLNYASDQGIDTDRSCMPAGQGIGGIDDVLPAGEIVTWLPMRAFLSTMAFSIRVCEPMPIRGRPSAAFSAIEALVS